MSTTTKRTVAAWTKAARHEVTLPSGFTCEIELPDLSELIKTGAIPNPLIEAAISAVQGQKKLDAEFIVQQGDLVNVLVALTVKDPVLKPEDVTSLPVEDRIMIGDFATRARDVDAVYHHLGGLHTNEDFRSFRGIPTSDPSLAGL